MLFLDTRVRLGELAMTDRSMGPDEQGMFLPYQGCTRENLLQHGVAVESHIYARNGDISDRPFRHVSHSNFLICAPVSPNLTVRFKFCYVSSRNTNSESRHSCETYREWNRKIYTIKSEA